MGKKSKKRRDMYKLITDSLCGMAENNNIVKQLDSSFLKMHKLKKIKRQERGLEICIKMNLRLSVT